MVAFTIKQLADSAGVSVRTLHYYDQICLLKPTSYTSSGYRIYGRDAVVALQQILLFRELGFDLKSIREIMRRPGFDVREALKRHRDMLREKKEQIEQLLETVDSTINELEGETRMSIRDYYKGFSDKQMEEYRNEARERWGEATLRESEERVMNMGPDLFDGVQAEGSRIFRSIVDHMSEGPCGPVVQDLVAEWRTWLENFHTYSDEAVLSLGRMYSQDPRFAAFFAEFDEEAPGFLTAAIEHYCSTKLQRQT